MTNKQKVIYCEECSFETNTQEKLEKHIETYHYVKIIKPTFILYFECEGSIDGRNRLTRNIPNVNIDSTGGQAAFEDGDLDKFGKDLTCASRRTGIKIYRAMRIHDPGLGLCIDESWLEEGLECGIFEEYDFPDDVFAT